jgi:hypothetical protein
MVTFSVPTDWILIDSGAADSSSALITLNTTDADLVVAIMNGHNDPAPMNIADTYANTWETTLAVNSGQGRSGITVAWFQGGTVGSGHVFTKNGGGADFADFVVLAYKGSASSPLDVSNHTVTGTAGTDTQPGSIEPTQDGDLIINAISFDDPTFSTAPTVDSGFTQVGFEQEIAGAQYGLFVSTLVQTAAAPVNPRTVRPVARINLPDVNVIISFKAAVGPAPSFVDGASLASLTSAVTINGRAVSTASALVSSSATVTAKGRFVAARKTLASLAGAAPIAGRSVTRRRASVAATGAAAVKGRSVSLRAASAALTGTSTVAARSVWTRRLLAAATGAVTIKSRFIAVRKIVAGAAGTMQTAGRSITRRGVRALANILASFAGRTRSVSGLVSENHLEPRTGSLHALTNLNSGQYALVPRTATKTHLTQIVRSN